MVDQEVNDNVTDACFQQDRHIAGFDVSICVRNSILMDA